MDKEFAIQVKVSRNRFWIDAIILAAGLLWITQGRIILGLIFVILAVAGYSANRRNTIRVSKKGIYYPSFPTRVFLWSNIENVILKDGLLTIDLKNNKLYQFLLLNQAEAETMESSFNEFSSLMLMKNSKVDPILN